MSSIRQNIETRDDSVPGVKLISDGYLGIPRSFAMSSAPGSTPFTVKSNTSCTTERNVTKSQKGKNLSRVNSGLTILPWDTFIYEPRNLNNLFHLERNGIITYDPKEVNVFFHATRMLRPSFGDVSENGQSWILTVGTLSELEHIRVWITERVSVFGVTLVKSAGLFGNAQKAPCLVVLDPIEGTVKDRLYHAFTKSLTAMERGSKFCIEINLNGCVESWCSSVTQTKCTAVGAKLIVTNGDERDSLMTIENILCCVACFPVWAIQTSIIQVCRRLRYEDYSLDFSAEEIRLHGTKGDAKNQRDTLFQGARHHVFRTKPAEKGLAQMDPRAGEDVEGHKYICMKKYDRRPGSAKPIEEDLDEYETVSVQKLLSHIRPRNSSTHGKVSSLNTISQKIENEFSSDEEETEIDKNLTDDGKIVQQSVQRKLDSHNSRLIKADVLVHASESSNPTRNHRKQADDIDDFFSTGKRTKTGKQNDRFTDNVIASSRHFRTENDATEPDGEILQDGNVSGFGDGEGMETILFKGYSRKVFLSDDFEDGNEQKKRSSEDQFKTKRKPQRNVNKQVKGKRNMAFEEDNDKDELFKESKKGSERLARDDNSRDVQGFKASDTNVHHSSQKFDESEEETRKRNLYFKYNYENSKVSNESSGDEFSQSFPDNDQPNQTENNVFKEFHYPKVLRDQEQDNEMALRRKGPLFMPDDDMFDGKATNVIPVGKTDKTCFIDTTDDDLDDTDNDCDNGNEGDIELTDFELDNDDEDDKGKEETNKNEAKDAMKNIGRQTRPKCRKTARYDSTRKYLGIQMRRKLRPDSGRYPIAKYGAIELL